MKKDYYAILGVRREASLKEIKQAYHRLAKKYHTDASRNPETKGQFQEIAEAYKVFSDPVKRQEYDSGQKAALTDKPREVVENIVKEIFRKNLEEK